MYPILFQSGEFVLASWHVFFVLGAFAGWFLLQSIRPDVLAEWSAGHVDKLFVALYLAGYLGARIFSIFIEDNVQSISEFFRQLLSFGAMTLYGGIIAVATVLIFYTKTYSFRVIETAKAFVGPGLVAIGIGRIGCFLNGDDFGRAVPDQIHPPTWAVRFPNLEDNIYRYPVQIWEALFGILWGLLIIVVIKRMPKISRFAADLGVVGYTSARFILEYYRGDERGQFFGTVLSTSQGISLVLLTLWIVYRLGFSKPEYR